MKNTTYKRTSKRYYSVSLFENKFNIELHYYKLKKVRTFSLMDPFAVDESSYERLGSFSKKLLRLCLTSRANNKGSFGIYDRKLDIFYPGESTTFNFFKCNQ